MRLRVLLSIIALLATACAGASQTAGGGDDVGSPTDSVVGDATADAAGGGAAGGTALRAVPLEEALAAGTDGAQLITGLLIDDGSGWRLCTAVAESYPPQCGGESVVVEGVDPDDHDLEEDAGVRWQESATVYGELAGEVITVTGPAASA